MIWLLALFLAVDFAADVAECVRGRRALARARRVLTAELRAEAVPVEVTREVTWGLPPALPVRARADARLSRHFLGIARIEGVRALYVVSYGEEWGTLYVVCGSNAAAIEVAEQLVRAAPIGWGVHVVGDDHDVPPGAARITTSGSMSAA